MSESQSKGLPDELFRQHLAAKTTLKRQHVLNKSSQYLGVFNNLLKSEWLN